ncbi:cytochrome-c peroxidase [Sinomicrobium pectinilyticum]|uniref:Cytochrome-c peroxidase n=1 Tax=Sinomicrobium pectinilyticum TaxID=1084421 RepID=A0A3N0E351_SINP1|nr:cytochrome c peroxidase [Sinomicrobium pectinilyticum]RNL82268.1 cytochrome-c peroxidase [Sinomicrobium pectinilyticum]
MRRTIFYLCILTGLSFSCKHEKAEQLPDWDKTQQYYTEAMNAAIRYTDSLRDEGVNGKNTKTFFKKLRIAFKKAEPYAAYLNPEVGHRVNGPALPVFLDDNQRVLPPVGLQKIEESIYEGGVSDKEFLYETDITRGMLVVLQKEMEKRELNAQRFFIATHQQLLRIISFSTAGFDTPVSYLSIGEIKTSLNSLKETYTRSIRKIITEKNDSLDKRFIQLLEQAETFVTGNPDFETFDRFVFIRDYMNPVTRAWVEIRKESGIWEPSGGYPFNFDAPTFFEENSFNLRYFTPSINRNPTKEQIALGKMLFFEPALSAGSTMSCATCHIPEKAYADGLVSNKDNRGRPLKRNTPTLLNVAFQRSFFWDGRSEDLLEQISSVFTDQNEFNTNVHEFNTDILKDSTYSDKFRQAFGHVPKNNRDIIRAISSYISTLNNFNSRFDKNIRGEEDDFSAAEKEGFNLFMGKALCATCHFIPLTGGTVPPFYKETEKEVIGVPETAENKMLDDDEGFYWKYEEVLHRGMFKTPSIRNIAETAPYMHNGVYRTLEEVMDFYNKGGGGGLGFDFSHQTLPFDNLELTPDEQGAIIAFMKTLSGEKVVDDY